MVNFFKTHDEYYKNNNKLVKIFDEIKQQYISVYTDKFNIVMDKLASLKLQHHPSIQKFTTPQGFYQSKYQFRYMPPSKIVERLLWTIFINSPTNKYFLTIDIPTNYTDCKYEAQAFVNEVIHRIRQRLLGRYTSKYFSGFAVQEQNKNGSWHYHIIIDDKLGVLSDNLKYTTEQVRLAIESQYILRFCHVLKYRIRIPIVQEDCWDLQLVREDDEELILYLTKLFEKQVYADASDNIGVLSRPNKGGKQDFEFGASQVLN